MSLLFVALLVALANGTVAWRTWAAFNQSSDQVAFTERAVDQTNALLSSLKDAETGQRGFLLTGKEEYLEPYRLALNDIPNNLAALTSLRGPGGQIQQLGQLRLLVETELGDLARTLEARQRQGPDAAIAIVRSDRGKADMDRIRALCSEITAGSHMQLRRATEEARTSADMLKLVTTAGSGFLFLILIVLPVTLRRGAARREEIVQDLEENKELITRFVRDMPAGVAMFDREMRYIQASDRWCSDHGLAQSEIVGRSHYEIFPDVPERWKELLRRCLAGETFRSEEDLFERADGRRTWLRWEIRPWGRPNAPPAGVLIFSEDITGRKQAEETLRDQHERLQAIVATAPGAICDFRLDPDGSTSLPYTSPGFRKILPELPDLTRDADPLFAAMHPDDRQRIRASVAESARQLTPWHESFRIITESRGAVWVEGHSLPKRQPNGSVHWYGFLTDITERMLAEQSLFQAQQAYRALADNSPDTISRMSHDYRYIFVNARILKVSGLPEQAIIGKRPEELGTPPGFAEECVVAAQRVFASGTAEDSEITYPTADGETLWDVQTVPEFGTDGSVQSVLRVGRDITERRRAEALASQHEEEVRERESIIATLFDTAAQAILGVGPDGRIQIANRMAEELFGYESGELLGQPLESLVPADVRHKHAAVREGFTLVPKRRTMGVGMDLQGCRKDGSEFPIEVSLSHLNTRRGFVAVAFVTDITVRKQNELALRNSEQELRKLSIALMTAGDDRARQIARELHDDITQRLAFLSIEPGKTAASWPMTRDLMSRLHSCQAKILDISEALRKVSHRMHPSILDDLGLSDALESMCRDMVQIEEVSVDFKARDIPETIDPALASCLYRVAQESFRNISKHARADSVSVVLSCKGDWLQLTILDSGQALKARGRTSGLEPAA